MSFRFSSFSSFSSFSFFLKCFYFLFHKVGEQVNAVGWNIQYKRENPKKHSSHNNAFFFLEEKFHMQVILHSVSLSLSLSLSLYSLTQFFFFFFIPPLVPRGGIKKKKKKKSYMMGIIYERCTTTS